MAYKAMSAKFNGTCKACGKVIHAGEPIVWESLHKVTFHPECKPVAPVVVGQGASLKPVSKPKAPAPKPVKKSYYGHGYGQPQSILAIGHDSPAPATQKGKGIHVLQKAGILSHSMGYVCTTLDDAIKAFGAIQGEKFCRPCPITARHGFVDSRVVKDIEGLKALWAETKAADPLGEMIVMPLVKADHNCVWRPGLLAIGPGHDGATAGQDSITVFLQEHYAASWRDLAVKAGVNPETQDPFIESVSHDAVDSVVTQIRAGVKGAPTAPDWVPVPQTVGQVIAIDGSKKADPDAMLAWETEAKTLTPGFHVVYDEGGNLGDHWSVHAQLAGIAVLTSFKPHVGQELPKMGQDLEPLEPQAIIYGFLGGLIAPSLAADSPAIRRKRTRATVAAILGTHHGLRMGGDGGVHLGASVALFLRLGQAAVWGEARHAYSQVSGFDPKSVPGIGPVKGKSRQQIFSQVLDDWTKGREGLRDVTRCFHLHWSGSFGGKAWAAIGHSLVALDAAMIELVKLPSRLNAKRVIAALTTSVNLAHNGVSAGCFLNKFCGSDWFDMAAALDPRAALMAGPIWYEATLADTGKRIELLSAIEKMTPINVGYPAPKGNVIKGHGDPTADTLTHAQTDYIAPSQSPAIPNPGQVHGGKVGSFHLTMLGEAAGLPGAPKAAAFKVQGGHVLHAQIALTSGGYVSGEVQIPGALLAPVIVAIESAPDVASFSGSGVTYKAATIAPDGKSITMGEGAATLTLLTTTVQA